MLPEDSKITLRYYFHYILVGLLISVIISVPVLLDWPVLYPVIIVGAISFIYLIRYRFELQILDFGYLIVLFALLAPPLNLSSSLPLIRPDEILIYIFCPLILLNGFKKNTHDPRAIIYIKIYSAFLLVFIVSSIYGVLFLDVPYGKRDFFEFVTTAKYLMVFFVFSAITIDQHQIKKILHYVLFLILLSGIFGLLQYYSLFGLDTLTAPFYLQDRLHIFDDRITGTFKNPNTFSSVLLLGHIIALTRFLFSKNLAEKYYTFFATLILVVLLLFAGSRTVLFIYFLITLSLLVLGVFTSGVSKKQLSLLIGFITIGFLLSISFLSYEIILRFQSGIDILNDDSLSLRFFVWFFNFQIFLESPIIGWGPAKALHPVVVDNEYLLILRRYGIIGLISFLGIYLYPLKISFSRFWKKKRTPYYFDIIIASIIVSFGIANITNGLFLSAQVMDFWIVLLGLYFAHLKSMQDVKLS
ncbi:MAG: O-antigen ligase family protein [Balneola sp.]